jgi:hypothetical protein
VIILMSRTYSSIIVYTARLIAFAFCLSVEGGFGKRRNMRNDDTKIVTR